MNLRSFTIQCENYTWNMYLNQDMSIVIIILIFIMEWKPSDWHIMGRKLSKIRWFMSTFKVVLLFYCGKISNTKFTIFKCIVQWHSLPWHCYIRASKEKYFVTFISGYKFLLQMFLSLLLLVTQLWKLREFKIYGHSKLPDLIPD